MHKEDRRMNVPVFSYIAIGFSVFLLSLSIFFMSLGLMHKAAKHNDKLILIFSILSVLLIIGIVWSVFITTFHKKENYNKSTIIIFFIFAWIGLAPIQLVIWIMHYLNFKIINEKEKNAN